jgi:hypothetical protein
MKKTILDIVRSPQTVFSFKELLLMWGNVDPKTAKARVNYYVRRGQLYALRRGLYAKQKDYQKFELACKLMPPAYISFETVLLEAGIVFQQDSSIFMAGSISKTLLCDGQAYVFKKIQDPILMNNAGIESHGTYYIASKERAYLDVLYLNKNYHFDNLGALDKTKVLAILPIYHNQRMERTVYEHFKTL